MYAAPVRRAWASAPGGARPTLPYEYREPTTRYYSTSSQLAHRLDAVAASAPGTAAERDAVAALLKGESKLARIGDIVQRCADRAAFWDGHWRDVFRCDVCLEHKPGVSSCAARAEQEASSRSARTRPTRPEVVEYVEALSRAAGAGAAASRPRCVPPGP